MSYSRWSCQPRDWTWVSHITGRCFNVWATREALVVRIMRLTIVPRGRQLVKTAGLTHFALCFYGASQVTVFFFSCCVNEARGIFAKTQRTFPLLGMHAIFLEVPIKMVSLKLLSAWWAAIYGVTQSQTWLKRLSSSSSNTLQYVFASTSLVLLELPIVEKLLFPLFYSFKNETQTRKKKKNLSKVTERLSSRDQTKSNSKLGFLLFLETSLHQILCFSSEF